MKTAGTFVRSILYQTVRILMFVQILLGILWIAGNFSTYQSFPETEELRQIADTLVTDEYVGILYPCVVRFAEGVSRLCPVPYYCLIYLMQLGLCFWTLWKLTGKNPGKIWLVLWLMTLPPAAQFNLAVLPQSPAVFMLLLCFYDSRYGKWIKAAVCWLLGGLLLPEFFLFGGGIYFAGLIFKMIRRRIPKRMVFQGIIAAVLVCLLTGITDSAAVEVHSRGRMARTPAAMALHRCVWPYFSVNRSFWAEEAKEAVSEESLIEISRDPGKVSREFGLVMEKTYGVKQSQSIYWKMAKDSFRIGTKKVVGDFTMDLLGYALSPFVIVWNLRGYGTTFSGWNYSMMQHRTPHLTKCYVYYAGNVLPFVLLLALALYLWNGDKRGFAANAQRMGLNCLGALSAVVALWYSLSASGMQDYKNAILITIFWGLLVTAFMEEKESSFNEQK